MSFKFAVTLNDPTSSASDAAIVADMNAAAQAWSSYIDGKGVIDIALNVSSTTDFADGGPDAGRTVGQNGGVSVLQYGTISELKTGVDLNGASADVTINISQSYVQKGFYITSDPATRASVPVGQWDMVSTLIHELGHGLGIAGERDDNGVLSGAESQWDRLVQIHSDGSAWFTGTYARAIYGGDVPVTTLHNGEDYYHLSNGTDRAASDVMNGKGELDGTIYGVSDLDLAILKDLGVPVSLSTSRDPLIDPFFYLSRNADVSAAHLSAETHYRTWGWHEGRDPNPDFSTAGYLSANPDVNAAGMNPLDHYDQYGWKEGRDPSATFDTTLYLQHNPDVAAAGVDPLASYLQYGQFEGRQAYAAVGSHIMADGFDAEYYLLANPDVGRAGMDPYQHYITYGWKEGRNPNAYFDDAGYLARYADVKAAGVNPLDHYAQYGWKEGRDPSASFDTKAYEAAYADVKAAGVDPLTHYLQYGVYEDRSAFGDGVLG